MALVPHLLLCINIPVHLGADSSPSVHALRRSLVRDDARSEIIRVLGPVNFPRRGTYTPSDSLRSQ
jgi:hypothetical protein